ncbi:MAG: hypothetical protein Q8K75_11390 [Chlamydiales bacterium]|nr:hypothetical protein [Chlamydiales bacterium]
MKTWDFTGIQPNSEKIRVTATGLADFLQLIAKRLKHVATGVCLWNTQN